MVKQLMRPHLPHVPKHCPLPLTIDEIIGAETPKPNPVRNQALLERCLESVGEVSLFTLFRYRKAEAQHQ